MKISTEQLRITQENELRKAQQQGGSGEDFGELLARRMGLERPPSAVSGGSASLQIQGPAFLPGLAETEAAQGLSSSEEAANRMDDMFARFERYAERIAQDETGGLREAYSLLQDVSGRIAGFRAEFPNAGEDMPELAALLDELDVFTTTETFKFNRGDYL